MLGCNKTITIVNSYHSPDTDEDVYLCHTFYGCSWYAQRMSRPETNGLSSAEIHKLRIPVASAAGVPFYHAQAWDALPPAVKAKSWTLAPGSKIIAGQVDSITPRQYAALTSGSCVTILGYHDNRDTAMPHWYVEGE